jgi:hypothetical protein
MRGQKPFAIVLVMRKWLEYDKNHNIAVFTASPLKVYPCIVDEYQAHTIFRRTFFSRNSGEWWSLMEGFPSLTAGWMVGFAQ